MRMYPVEVDEEVYLFVKNNAEPLEDNFNSALKRLLPIPKTRGLTPSKIKFHRLQPEPAGPLPEIPKQVPQLLRQILEVVHLVIKGPYSRRSATQYVAGQHKKRNQTIIDKYTRQLGLKASEFDRLLDQEGLADLRKILKSKFPGYTQLIDDVITPH